MIINNSEEFEQAIPRFHTTLAMLLDISETMRPTAWMHSTVEAWILEKEYLRKGELDETDERFEHFKEGLEGEMPMHYAFQLSDALMKCFSLQAKDFRYNVEEHYKIYKEILELSNKWQKLNCSFSEIESEFNRFIQIQYPEVASSFNSIVSRQLKTAHAVYSSISSKSKTFILIKGFMLPDLEGDKPSQKLLESSLRLLDLDKKFTGLREAALMLEHIGKKYRNIPERDWPPFWEVQNEIIDIGLRWAEKVHPAFILGAQSTFATMLMANRADLIATFITERIAEQQLGEMNGFQEKPLQTEKLKQELQSILRKFRECLERNAHAPRMKILDELTDILLTLKPLYSLTEFDLHRWSHSIHYILLTIDHYKPQLGNRSSLLPRIGWGGDSVSAGVGVQDHEKQNRWVQTVTRVLKKECEIINFSIPGQTTEDGANDIADNIKYFLFDAIVYTGGGNNIYQEEPTVDRLAQMEADMVKFAKTCFERGVKLVIWGLGVPETFDHYKEWREAIILLMAKVKANEAFREMQDRFHVLPLPTTLLTESHMFKKHMPYERLHPNTEGQQALAKHSIATLKLILRSETERLKKEVLDAEPKPIRAESPVVDNSGVPHNSDISIGFSENPSMDPRVNRKKEIERNMTNLAQFNMLQRRILGVPLPKKAAGQLAPAASLSVTQTRYG